jgi:hypothetical protein
MKKKWSTLLSLWRKDSTVFRTMNAYLEGGAALGILIVELTISRAVASIKTADQIAIAITNAVIYAAGKTRKARGHSR